MDRSGGFGSGDRNGAAHSASGSSGSFDHHRDRRDDFPYYNRASAFPYGSTADPYSRQQRAPSGEQQGRCLCCIGPAAVLMLGTLGVLFGIYSPLKIEAGLNYSRILDANRLFVQEIQVKNLENLRGPAVYSFHDYPALKEHREWSYDYQQSLDGQHHQEWALWLNKGSTMTMEYGIKTPGSGIVLAVLKGEEHFNRWLDDPSDSQSTVYWQRVKGEGRLKFVSDENNDYYFTLGNTNYHDVEVELRLRAKMKIYDTEHYDSRCPLSSGVCKVSLPFFRSTSVLLTTPYEPTEEGDVWRFTVTYKTRWATYIVGYGALLAIGFLVLKPWKKPDDTKKDEKSSETASLINRKGDASTSEPSTADSDTAQVNPSGEEHLCVVCLDAAKDCFFDPCGHCATCYSCGQRIKESENSLCPICRQSIATVRRLFL